MPASIFRHPLYHGTSTLFLPGILEFGLGGKNPLAELKIYEFVREIDPLVEEFLKDTDTYNAAAAVWPAMVQQRSASMNYAHGDTYLTPAESTAIRYAASERYGSELLTHALDFLRLLVDRDVPSIRTSLTDKYPQIFKLLNISPAPVLLRVDGITEDVLLGEDGGSAEAKISNVYQTYEEIPHIAQECLQQCNFRLRTSVSPKQLRGWIVAIKKWSIHMSDYDLYELCLAPRQSAS